MADMKNVFDKLNNLLGNTDLSDVTADSSGFSDLPDGYYLCEVEKADLKESKSSHEPMVAFQFKVVEDGHTAEITDDGDVIIEDIKKTANRKIFVYYVLKDETAVRRFATDMLKFEGEVAGESLLPKEAFMTSETLIDALDVLVGMRIYICASTTEKDGSKSQWNNLISWKRVAALELPM